MSQDPAEQLNDKNAEAINAEMPTLSEEKKRELSPEQLKRLECEIRKQELLAQLEEENRDTPLGRLCRSKNFWYAIFGTIFVAIMLAMIAWAARDLGYIGK